MFLLAFGVLVVLAIMFEPDGIIGLLRQLRLLSTALPVTSNPLISVSGLTKRFGGLTAVSDLSFAFFPGEILALIGPNGAGKTTTFNLIAGADAPSAGTIVLDGERIDGLPAHRIAALGVMRTFQHNMSFAEHDAYR